MRLYSAYTAYSTCCQSDDRSLRTAGCELWTADCMKSLYICTTTGNYAQLRAGIGNCGQLRATGNKPGRGQAILSFEIEKMPYSIYLIEGGLVCPASLDAVSRLQFVDTYIVAGGDVVEVVWRHYK